MKVLQGLETWWAYTPEEESMKELNSKSNFSNSPWLQPWERTNKMEDKVILKEMFKDMKVQDRDGSSLYILKSSDIRAWGKA